MVAEVKAKAEENASVIYVPMPFVFATILEAMNAKLYFFFCIKEGIT